MANLMMIVSVLCGFHLIALVAGMSYVLDRENSGDTMWKIKGDSAYLENGQQLRRPPVTQFLPNNFKYTHFDLSEGIWAVVPNQNRDCLDFEEDKWSSEEHGETTTKPQCDLRANATFQCSLSAQLLDSVSVKYNFGGNATIRITGGDRRPIEMSANFVGSDHWDHFKVEKMGGRMMTVEALVKAEGDYVLIDMITVETLEAPTTHRPAPTRRHPTTTTTSEPTTKEVVSTTPATPPTEGPTPASGQSGIHTISMISHNIIFASVLLTTVKIILF